MESHYRKPAATHICSDCGTISAPTKDQDTYRKKGVCAGCGGSAVSPLISVKSTAPEQLIQPFDGVMSKLIKQASSLLGRRM